MKLKKLAIFFALIALLVLAPIAGAQQPQQPTPVPTPLPNSWQPPDVYKLSDDTAYAIGDPVVFTIIIVNPLWTDPPPPDPPQPNQAVWYNVRVTDYIDPVFRIDGATSTMGTVTIDNVTNTVVVNGGITLAPGDSIFIIIYCTVIGGAGETVINDVTLEYDDENGSPQPPKHSDTPVRIIIIEEEVPVIPEASTLILLGGAVTGLAGYVGLQIRARRRNEGKN
jgi:hypothetical protein